MGFFDALKTDSWKENTIKINILDPRTGDKMEHNGKFAFIEIKSTESQEWIKQIEENTKHASKKKTDEVSVKSERMNGCRALAAVTVAAYLPDVVEFTPSDLEESQPRDQIRSKLRKFYFDVYAEFTEEAIKKASNNVLFMPEQEDNSSNESPTEDGAQAMTPNSATTNESVTANG